MSAVKSSDMTTITEPERGQVERANASGLTPVMFVHGLFLLPSSSAGGMARSAVPITAQDRICLQAGQR